MRYGKKLALCLQDESNSDKPFISHKAWREVLSRAVKEHRAGSTPEMITALDEEFLAIMVSDYEKITQYCIQVNKEHLILLEGIAERAHLTGVTADGPIARMAVEIQNSLINSSYPLLTSAAAGSLRALWSELATLVSDLCNTFNDVAWKWQQHLNYIDVNIAGFRKTIKQRGKQIILEGPARHFQDYCALAQPALSIQVKFATLHSQLDHCLKIFAPGADLYLSKPGSETVDAAEISRSEKTCTGAIESDLVQLLLSLMPRE